MLNTLDTTLNKEEVLKTLQSDGPFSRGLKGFESRKQQQMMMSDVIDAFNSDAIALIEAGTGTGKSMAYLIPSILWAAQNEECTVISTNTINLQEQLIHKDIPHIKKALGVETKAVLVKGMSNYLCLRKLDDSKEERHSMTQEEGAEFDKIEAWGQNTSEGSRSDLPFVPTPNTWERVCAESDTCNHNKCPFFEQCHFIKARKKVYNAKILVVNHSLLFTDLAKRAETENYKDPCILPPYQRIILDESHNIEEIATHFFSGTISRVGMFRLLGRLASDKYGKRQGKLILLNEKLLKHYKHDFEKIRSILSRLELDLAQLQVTLKKQLEEVFDSYALLVQQVTGLTAEIEKETKLRLRSEHYTHPVWKDQIIPGVQQATLTMKQYVQAIQSLIADMNYLKNEDLDKDIQGVTLDILALTDRLTAASNTFQSFVSNDLQESTVQWIEAKPFRMMINIRLANADLDIAQPLAKHLFNKFSTLILCSATLTTNKKFDFFKERLGIVPELLEDRTVIEKTYESPFDYPRQALLAIPRDLPNPSDPSFVQSASEQIWEAIQASRGNAFVLFTSYSMLKRCASLLSKKLTSHRFSLFKQGDDNRQALLKQFKETDRSVLFGTDSFWEGVDVVGEDLRCVIIVKLPFQVPTEPIIQARTEAITAKGGSAFMEYSVPQAIVKFKQGFGRLIRHKRDRGCIVCLDPRLLTKHYGQLFLNSLPDCQRLFVESKELQQQMDAFYRKTYHLVKG